jgi:hypothetical protein
LDSALPSKNAETMEIPAESLDIKCQSRFNSKQAFHPLRLWISYPGCLPIVLFLPAFGVGWLGLAQKKIDSDPDTSLADRAAAPIRR